jgi:hypothetical protein
MSTLTIGKGKALAIFAARKALAIFEAREALAILEATSRGKN